MTENPVVQLGVWDVFCPRHLEPFRANWPKGYPLAMMWLFQYAASMPAIQDAADRDANKLTAAVREFSPVCCFVPDDVREAVILRALDA